MSSIALRRSSSPSTPSRENSRLLGSLLFALFVGGLALTPAPSILHAQNPNQGTSDEETKKITEGKIRVLSLLRFLQDHTDKMVQYPSAAQDPAFTEEVTIDVLGDVDPLTLPIVRVLLETNGYSLYEQTLEDGNEVIQVRADNSRTPSPGPKITPTRVAGEELTDVNNQELATLILQLKHTDTSVVSQALRDLLGIQGSGDNTFRMVNVTSSETLIIKAKQEVLEYVQELVKYIDVEAVGPESILNIRELTYADADDLVSIIEEVLNTGGTTPVRRTQPRAGQRGGNQNNATTALAGEGTRLIADARTQKIIIQSTDDDEVELVHQLIDELDTRIRSFRRNTHTYRVKFLRADDLSEVLRNLIEGSSGSLNGNRTNRNRNATQSGAQAQQQSTPTRIVPHPETNTLIIQAEPEEWNEISGILEEIDARRRQVFLEAALVQVTDSSNLNYTIEFLAGNLDDQQTRVAAQTAFGLSSPGIDPDSTTFTRTFAQTALTGLVTAVSNDGQLPAILRAIKSDSEAKILATPFILADDNQESSINIDTEVFFETSNTTNVNTTTGLGSESAGIALSLTPTISKEVVLLNLNLTVSSFAGASSSTGALPDRSTNTITSNVTIPDGRLFIIGGLARENESTVVDKIPFLGDLPLIGRFFQSRGSDHSRDNLYVFLTAHIIDEERSADLELITDQAIEGVRSFGDNVKLNKFELPRKKQRGNPQ